MNQKDEKSREEFFLIATHELRTPLTAIRASAELILSSYADHIKNDDVKELLTNIDTASIRLIKIINDFLEAPSLEKGKVQIKNKIFDVAGLIGKVINDLKILATRKNITLSYDNKNNCLLDVCADKNGIEQILINLIGNAIRFTSEGGVTVKSEMDGDFIKVSVSDTGTGISEKDQKFLFKKFQKADKGLASSENMQSTGLGLYISQLLISKMGGTIKLEKSELEKGSTFSFTIPIAK